MDDQKKDLESANSQGPTKLDSSFHNQKYTQEGKKSSVNAQEAKEAGQATVLEHSRPELLALVAGKILAGLSPNEPRMAEEALGDWWPSGLSPNAFGPIISCLHRRGRIIPDGFGYGRSRRSKRSLVQKWRAAL